MMKHVLRVCVLSVFLVSMSAMVAPVSAHDGSISLTFDDTGAVIAQTNIHYEPDNTDPLQHKGWAVVTVTNTGNAAWGDMHFQVVGMNVSSVDWMSGGLLDPTYKLNSVPKPMTFVIDNVNPQATLDMYFYANPVLPGQTATFSAYTDNTSQMLPFFGLMVYPTPVPEPATLAMLGLGGLMFFRKRR
jgi:hypothetical protein